MTVLEQSYFVWMVSAVLLSALTTVFHFKERFCLSTCQRFKPSAQLFCVVVFFFFLYGGRDSNSQNPDSKSGAYSIPPPPHVVALTGVETIVQEPIPMTIGTGVLPLHYRAI